MYCKREEALPCQNEAGAKSVLTGFCLQRGAVAIDVPDIASKQCTKSAKGLLRSDLNKLEMALLLKYTTLVSIDDHRLHS